MSVVMYCVYIAFVYIYVAVAEEIIADSKPSTCWNANGQCNIEASLTREALAQTFVVNFNCSNDVNDLVTNGYAPIRQIIGVNMIKLNGCNVTQQSATIGIEHIEDPLSVTHLTIYSFKLKTFYSKHFDKFKSLVTIQLIDNAFEEIIDGSFQDIFTVETLVISNNNLKVIATHAVLPLIRLKNLTVIEPNLSIKELDYPSNYSLKHIWLAVYAYEWQVLPNSIETLEIINTKLTFHTKTFELKNCTNLKTLSISRCQFNGFLPAMESSSLQILNLTENNLNQFPDNDLPNLEILDISGNSIGEIKPNSFKSMVQLREIYADDNRIERISKQAFDSNPNLNIVQISGNRLKSMEFTDHLTERSLQIFIDDNPWSCAWVLNMSSERPAIFAIFHYNKYLEKINVRGLNCSYDESDDGYNVYESSIATETTPMSSTLNSTFADNLERSYRRNPRNTLLITIIILVVGVAVLFFLLYLHIKCRENTVEPFYRSLPYDTHPMSDRIDIIRRNLPPTDYEAPIATRGDGDLKEVIYEQIPEKYANYDKIPEQFSVNEHDGCDHVNNDLSYK